MGYRERLTSGEKRWSADFCLPLPFGVAGPFAPLSSSESSTTSGSSPSDRFRFRGSSGLLGRSEPRTVRRWRDLATGKVLSSRSFSSSSASWSSASWLSCGWVGSSSSPTSGGLGSSAGAAGGCCASRSRSKARSPPALLLRDYGCDRQRSGSRA